MPDDAAQAPAALTERVRFALESGDLDAIRELLDPAGAGTLLVGLEVIGTPAAREAAGAVERWQVLTVRGGRIADIRGFDDRKAAAARAGVA